MLLTQATGRRDNLVVGKETSDVEVLLGRRLVLDD